MKIEEGTKLDFCDVLIRPKRSNTPSRKSIKLSRVFRTLSSNRTLECIPIMAANMSTTGTFAMAEALQKCMMLTAIHKFYPLEDLVKFFKLKYTANFCFYTLGIRDEEFEKLKF